MIPAYIGSHDDFKVIKNGIPPQCAPCIHLLTIRTCEAYPNGIPDALWNNQADHRQPYPGDNGIRFEKRSTE